MHGGEPQRYQQQTAGIQQQTAGIQQQTVGIQQLQQTANQVWVLTADS